MLQISEIKEKLEEFARYKQLVINRWDKDLLSHIERLEKAYMKEYAKALGRIFEEEPHETKINMEYWR